MKTTITHKNISTTDRSSYGPLYPNPALLLTDHPPVVLLAMCIFGEARGESEAAQGAVAQVVVNRAKYFHKSFGSQRGLTFYENLVKVITKPCQFSCFLPEDVNFQKVFDPLTHDDPGVWDNCMKLATHAVESYYSPDTATHNSDHYLDQSIEPPAWADPAKETVKIGRLRFFRLYLPPLERVAGEARPSGTGRIAATNPSTSTATPAAISAAGVSLPTSLPAPPPPIARDPRYGLRRWLGSRELSSMEASLQGGERPNSTQPVSSSGNINP